MKDVSSPPEFSRSDEDETEWQRLKEDEIPIRDTAVGRERARQQQVALTCLAGMTEEERVANNMPLNVLERVKEMAIGEVAEV